jgi:hypothetical protein
VTLGAKQIQQREKTVSIVLHHHHAQGAARGSVGFRILICAGALIHWHALYRAVARMLPNRNWRLVEEA